MRTAAFLRAINVGGRRMTNDELVAPFVALGLTDAVAYQAAGNVIFASEDDGSLRGRIEAALEAAFGFAVPACLRSLEDLADLVAEEPFTVAQLAATTGKVQVVFCLDALTNDQRAAGEALATGNDELSFGDRHVYWLPREGISTSEFKVDALAKVLGPITVRTLGTVERIVKKFG